MIYPCDRERNHICDVDDGNMIDYDCDGRFHPFPGPDWSKFAKEFWDDEVRVSANERVKESLRGIHTDPQTERKPQHRLLNKLLQKAWSILFVRR